MSYKKPAFLSASVLLAHQLRPHSSISTSTHRVSRTHTFFPRTSHHPTVFTRPASKFSPMALINPPQKPPVSISTNPLLGTVVIARAPEVISAISEHPDAQRVSFSRPWVLALILYGTQFATPAEKGSKLPGGEWCLAFTTTDENQQPRRRRRTETNLATLLTPERIQKVKEYVLSDMDSKELAQAVIQVLGPPAIGYDGKLPGEILNALSQLSEFSASQNPLKYLPSRAARQTIERWLKKAFPDEPYYVDILHDLGTMYSGLSAGLLSLRKVQEGDDIFTHMAKNPVLPITARIAGKETDFGGVLDRMVPEESLIVFDLASAAHATHDIGYVFGTGISERQCPFKDMFFELGENVLKPNAP